MLIGVSYTSAISIDTKQSIVSKASEEECLECKEIDSRQLVVLEKQLNRIEVYTKLLLILSRNNTEVKEKCQEILDIINSNKELDNPILCAIFEPIFYLLVNIANFFHYLVSIFKENPLILGIILGFYTPFEAWYVILSMLGAAWDCEWDSSKSC